MHEGPRISALLLHEKKLKICYSTGLWFLPSNHAYMFATNENNSLRKLSEASFERLVRTI